MPACSLYSENSFDISRFAFNRNLKSSGFGYRSESFEESEIYSELAATIFLDLDRCNFFANECFGFSNDYFPFALGPSNYL